MAEFLDPSQLSLSLSENKDSTDTSVVMEDDEGEAEEFYEKIEAPKFIDFTVPNHYCPDDRYWFCQRVGCDQQHEEEMDSETIYKNFVLRVMAARSPNVRLRKALNKGPSSSKCPHSAPPKSSKSRLAFISSNSQKIIEEKKKVVRSLLKPVSTPTTTTKPVAAKYLTTPRNKNAPPKQNSFRSVRNLKSTSIELPKNRMVAKALVFRSPKKFIKVKTSVELRIPLTKLRERTKKVEITSQRKQFLVHSSKSSKNYQNQEAKSVRSIKSKGKLQLSKPSTSKELKGNDCSNLDINAKSRSCTTSDISRIQNINNHKQHTMDSAASALFEQQKSIIDTCLSSAAAPLTKISDSALSDDSGVEANRLLIAEENNPNLQAPNGEENNSNNRNKQFITTETELNENDDKENAAASDQNRAHVHNHYQKMKGKILGFQDACGKVHKIAQAKDKSSGTVDPVTKFKRPKLTTPKPFRLRTDERGILKEANLERKNNILPRNESAVSKTLGTNLHRKQGNDQRYENHPEQHNKYNYDMHEGREKEAQKIRLSDSKKARFKTAAATITPQRLGLLKHREPKPRTSPLEGKTIQSLKNFRKIKSSQQKQQVQHQGLTSRRKMISYSTTSRPLEVICETLEPQKGRNLTANGGSTTSTASDASLSSSRGRRPVNIAKEPNINSPQVQRNCGRNRILGGFPS